MAKAAVKKETVEQEQKPVETQAEVPETKPEKIQAPSPQKPATVEVKNITKTWLRQPSSGVRIDAGQIKPLNNDGWLEGQVTARLLVIQ